MATVNIKKPNVITLEYRQEKTDDNYGSCLWANFNFDLDRYDLSILSDCGNYAYGWVPTPDTEPFLELMARLDETYLLGKISSESVIDFKETWSNAQNYINYVLGDENPDFDLEEIEEICRGSSESDVYNGLLKALEYTNADNEFADDYELLVCITKTYPLMAKRIVKIFIENIEPKIKEMLKAQ